MFVRTYFFLVLDTSVEGEAKPLSVSVYLNKALCQQKLEDLDEVRHAVSSSITYELNFLSLSIVSQKTFHFSVTRLSLWTQRM